MRGVSLLAQHTGVFNLTMMPQATMIVRKQRQPVTRDMS
jgi:hypothetical protein